MQCTSHHGNPCHEARSAVVNARGDLEFCSYWVSRWTWLLHTMSISTLWDLPISGWVAVVPTLLSFSIIPLNVHHMSDWVAAKWSWIFATMASYCSTTWEFKGLHVNCIARCLISYACGNGTGNTWIHSRAQYICPYSVCSFVLALSATVKTLAVFKVLLVLQNWIPYTLIDERLNMNKMKTIVKISAWLERWTLFIHVMLSL